MNRLDALNARMVAEKSYFLNDGVPIGVSPPAHIDVEKVERLVAVLQLLADYSPLNILPWEQQRREMLAYWLAEEEQKRT